MPVRARLAVVVTSILLLGAVSWAGWPEYRSQEPQLEIVAMSGDSLRVTVDVPGRKLVKTVVKIETSGKLTCLDGEVKGQTALRSVALDLPDEKSRTSPAMTFDQAIGIAREYANENHRPRNGTVWTDVDDVVRSGDSWDVYLSNHREHGRGFARICISVNRAGECQFRGGFSG